MENLVHQLQNEVRTLTSEVSSQKGKINSLNSRINSLSEQVKLLNLLTLPPMQAIVYNILLKTAGTHLFWAAQENCWLSREGIKERETELRWMRHKYPQESVEQAAKRVVSEMAAAAEERASGFQTVVGENEKRQRRVFERSEEKAVRAPAPEIDALSINSSDYPLGQPVEDDLLKFIKAEESCVHVDDCQSSRLPDHTAGSPEGGEMHHLGCNARPLRNYFWVLSLLWTMNLKIVCLHSTGLNTWTNLAVSGRL
ncbi:hypothetical protein B0H11DRAFT_1966065 [Mycena galericulata]|nr:hypothetical protein B0H11DRAFT_1966065 [Mycena galericulata]